MFYGNIDPKSADPVNGHYKGGSIQVARRIQQDKTATFINAKSARKSNQIVGNGQINFPGRNPKNKAVFEEMSVPMPVYVDVSYTINIRTEYQQQMNEIIQPFLTKTNGVNYDVIRRDNHQYELFSQGDLNLNNNKASSSDYWGTTEPTASLFGVKGGGVDINTNTDNTIFYCWTSIPGYSKFGSYLGNAGSNGPLILTGFKPAWVMIKRTTSTGEWFILDKKRNPINTGTKEYLDADTTDSKGSLEDGAIDWLSNGFKIKQNSSQINNGAHIYMAFAEHPFLGDGTNPCTAV